MEFFEKQVVNLKAGTREVIQGYLDNNPELWDSQSHFIRCALEREFRRLRAEGKFSQKV